MRMMDILCLGVLWDDSDIPRTKELVPGAKEVGGVTILVVVI